MEVLRHFRPGEAARVALQNAVRIDHFYALSVNLKTLDATAPRKIGGSSLQPLSPDAIDVLYGELLALGLEDRQELLARILFFKRGFRHCHAMRENGGIAYLHWLVYPSENDVLRRAWRRRFKPLAPREVLIENAFTFPAHRGRGFLRFGTWQLLVKARDQGYARATTFVRQDRIEALNTFMSLGFRIQKRIREYNVCGWPWRVS
jgi:hypothetical protein